MKKILFFAICSSLSAHVTAMPMQSLLPLKSSFIPHAAFKSKLSNPTNLQYKAGGFGGNMQIGKLTYSGETNALPNLWVQRDESGNCYLQNQNVTINNYNDGNLIKFNCSDTDPTHNNIYWDANLGETNGGYSPENDALYAADVMTNLFKDWYNMPPLLNEKQEQKPISIYLHASMDNMTFWGDSLYVGDGIDMFYPLSSLNTLAYGVGVLFTQQHSNLDWWESESGGIEVAFDCITAMAAEFYTTGKNTWQIGGEISKTGTPLHYLDQPSKNCAPGRQPGEYCDIDFYKQYTSGLSSYYTAGLYNHAFYLLANTPGWDTHKAYDVFVRANMKEWKSDTNLHTGLCGLLQAAYDLKYDQKAIIDAFAEVGIDASAC